MPLFITPMMKAPITAPVTLPTPPEAEAPPMKQAAITSSSKPSAGLGRRRVEPGREDQAGECRQHTHVDEGVEGQPLGLDAGQLRRLLVAADRVDPPADGRAHGDEGVDHDQRRHDDQHVGQALVGRQQEAEIHDDQGDDRVLGREEDAAVPAPSPCFWRLSAVARSFDADQRSAAPRRRAAAR